MATYLQEASIKVFSCPWNICPADGYNERGTKKFEKCVKGLAKYS
jgi:hypothetical protein